MTLNAVHQQWVQDQLWCAQGDVQLHYQDISLRCDEIEVDLKTMHLQAEGNVILDQGQTRMACSRMEFDLEKKLGTLYNVDAFLPPTYHFRGEEIEKLDETHYRFHRGLFTSCELSDTKSPPWSIEVRDALVELEGYGHFRDAALKVRGVPIFYTPRLLWPIKRDRAAGFLVPNVRLLEPARCVPGQLLLLADLALVRRLPVRRRRTPRATSALGQEVRWAPAQNAFGWMLPLLRLGPREQELGVEGHRQAQPALPGWLRAPRRAG